MSYCTWIHNHEMRYKFTMIRPWFHHHESIYLKSHMNLYHEFIYALNSMKSNVSWLNSYKWIHKWNHGCVQDSGCYCRLLLWRTAGQGGCGGPLFASFQANYGLTGDEMLKICQACLSPMKETIETFNLRDYPRINVTTSRTLLRRSSKRARADSSNAMHKY